MSVTLMKCHARRGNPSPLGRGCFRTLPNMYLMNVITRNTRERLNYEKVLNDASVTQHEGAFRAC